MNGAWLGDAHVPVSAETARRIACDAGKVRMTHRNKEILSVGRKTRTIPPPVRRALEFRDRGCRFPGCTSRHCDAHHIDHWADEGETKLSNLVLLCRRHHRLLHEGGFQVRMGADGAVQFFHPRGRPLHESPAPPPIGPYPCDVSHRERSGTRPAGATREHIGPPAIPGTRATEELARVARSASPANQSVRPSSGARMARCRAGCKTDRMQAFSNRKMSVESRR